MNEMNGFNEVFNVISGIIKKITDNAGLDIEPSHTANDIKNWDSLRHVMIINEIENHYVIQFDLMEMLEISCVGDICQAVLKKQKQSR